MKAITLWQPWASWIAWGWKTIETRRHNLLRVLSGQTIAIHAGKRWHDEALQIAQDWLTREQWNRTLELDPDTWRPEKGGRVTGIVCTARVWYHGWLCLRAYSPGAMCDCAAGNLFGIFLTDVKPFDPPVPAIGHQGIWNWTPPPPQTAI